MPTPPVVDGRHRVQQRFEQHAVMPVRWRDQHRQRRPQGVDDYMTFAAWPAAIRGVRAGLGPPRAAGMLVLSTHARDQSR